MISKNVLLSISVADRYILLGASLVNTCTFCKQERVEIDAQWIPTYCSVTPKINNEYIFNDIINKLISQAIECLANLRQLNCKYDAEMIIKMLKYDWYKVLKYFQKYLFLECNLVN